MASTLSERGVPAASRSSADAGSHSGESTLLLHFPGEGTNTWTATCSSRGGSPYASSKQHRKCGRIVAGHSLGGALATLAAYDIRKQLLNNQQGNVRVICYTFAAPRTGNHAFARDYNAMVPDTWSIINDQVSSLMMPLNTYAALAVVTCTTCVLSSTTHSIVGAHFTV